MKSGVITRDANGKIILAQDGEVAEADAQEKGAAKKRNPTVYNAPVGNDDFPGQSAHNVPESSVCKQSQGSCDGSQSPFAFNEASPDLVSAIADMLPGEWRKLPAKNSFFDVAFTKAEHEQLLERFGGHSVWGSGGPKQVFHEWNSLAFDRRGHRLLFTGGGHGGYGGNEIYQFSLKTLEWSRISNPSPLTDQFDPVRRPKFWRPGDMDGDGAPDAPNAAHNYDGIEWNPVTNSLWLFEQRTSYPMNRFPETFLAWEYDEVNGKWKHHPVYREYAFSSSTFVESLNKILVINHKNSRGDVASLFGSDGAENLIGQVRGHSMAGESGVMFTIPGTGEIYQAERDSIFQLQVTEKNVTASRVVDYPEIEGFGYAMPWNRAGYAYRPVDQKIYIWNGDRDVVTLDRSKRRFERLLNEQSGEMYPGLTRGTGKVYGKWIYLGQLDVFLGITSAMEEQGGGWWIYRPGPNAADITKLKLGRGVVDARTTESIGVFIPVVDGDSNYNSEVRVEYRKAGDTEWLPAMSLLRLRPELVGRTHDFDKSPPGFAGSIFGLTPATPYTIRLSASDPDGVRDGSADFRQEIVVNTRSVPSDRPELPRELYVSNEEAFQSAIDAAKPGDVILLSSGEYGSKVIAASGTEANPIIITGQGELTPSAGSIYALQLNGSYIQVEGLSFTGGGIRIGKPSSGVVIRGNKFSNIGFGIDAKGGHKNLYIVDNVLQGPVVFPDNSKAVRQKRGIIVTGQDIEVAYNTLSGFGDSLGMSSRSELSNIGIHFHNNLILDSGDDGIEMDFSLRNTAAYENMIVNTFKGISFQPVYGGPAYVFRNIVFNAARGPIKISPESDDSHGMYVVHNTMIKSGEAWLDFTGTTSLAYIVNNIFVGQNNGKRAVHNTDKFILSTIDYNLWSDDGAFSLNGVSGGSFSSYQAKALFSKNGRVADSHSIFSSLVLDFDVNGYEIYRKPDRDFSLSVNSPAINAGLYLPNLSTNRQPDLGAVELRSPQPHYGVRH